MLESEIAPVSAAPKPVPPPRPFINPRVVSQLIEPNLPAPLPVPNSDIQRGPSRDFSSYADGNGGGTEEFETVLLAQHMPRFSSCTTILNQDQERFYKEAAMIRLIQSCAIFPKRLVDARVIAVVFLQFNVDEFGDVSSPSILKSAYPDLDQSALEALNCLPQMTTGTQHGKPV
nr:hypothetical protein [uncultured bacterium]